MSGVQPSPTVWARPRRERPALTVDRIVDEAVSLMDAEGLDALTMRTLGARLGAGATSMYRHVANREELLELAVDRVYAEIEVPHCGRPETWRMALNASAHNMRSMVARHGWIAAALPAVGLYYLGPNVLRLNESLYCVLDIAGYPAAEIDTAVSTLLGYVIGMSVAECAWLTKIARGDKSEQELLAELRPVVERAVAGYPKLSKTLALRGESDIRAVRYVKFQYGLDRVLDGLQARLGGRVE
ncbi:TetR/AcrR family transcriptional regulator [Nocardia sp. CDC160]|uniref:TetR/AcrR family transcriptional regulator n=1 Tax=Nocardia sp. CDC160 TaxID=3112166 RepID=UPI002DB6F809|nr:TetR/AcrR family transcriptional regulator [Nocardia sp. CDC160]MEC3916832.1 TetR/AcrR family transcriptional regulator [Nocardia sp. CDC160]